MNKTEEAKKWWREYRRFLKQVKRIQSDPTTLDDEKFSTMTHFCDKQKLHKMAGQICNELNRRLRRKKREIGLASAINVSRDFASPELLFLEKEKRQKKRISEIMGVTYVEDIKEDDPVFFYENGLKVYSNSPIKNRESGYWRVVEYRQGKVCGEKHFATKKGAEEYASAFYQL